MEKIRNAQWLDVPPTQTMPLVSIDGRPTLVVVHLFAGRRRSGDLHSHLHTWSQLRGDPVLILSMDTAICWQRGDLRHESSNWKTLQAVYDAGLVSCTVCGPPCETFSEARFQEVAELGSRAPRPLRSAQRLLGLEDLRTGELLQVRQGSAFVLQTQYALSQHLRHGGMFVKEHPATPEAEDRPTIWRAPSTSVLRRLPEVQYHQIGQWLKTPKPTGLLAVRLPRFFSSVWARRLPDVVKPQATSIGLDHQTKAFQTSALKEYPAAFSSALAGALTDQAEVNIRNFQTHTVTDVAPPLLRWMQDVASCSRDINVHGVMRADYQPRA
eukprot:Skav222132  [mRNA]  locus=scaffold1181:850210:851187:+ [translate_table: standard]